MRTAAAVRRARSSAHEGAAAEVEGVEVDVAEPQDGGAELYRDRARLLHDHAVRGEGADDPVHGRRRKPQAGGQLGQAHPAGALERHEDPDGSVDGLDHDGTFLAKQLLDGRYQAALLSIFIRHISNDIRTIGDRRVTHLGVPWTRPPGPEAGRRALGTAFLVFIGVGSVPATLIVNGDAPFTMADLGMISLAFGDRGRGHRLRPRARRRQPHQPGRHARARGHRQVPLVAGARLHRRPGGRRHRRRRRDHRRARHRGQRRRPRRGVVNGSRHRQRAGLHRRVRRHVHPRVHDLRRDPPQGGAGVRRCRDRPGRLRRDHPGGAGHRRAINPARTVGPMLVQQIPAAR